MNVKINQLEKVGEKPESQKWLDELCIVIKNGSDLSSDEMMKRIYDVCHDDDKKIKRSNQKNLFGMVLEMESSVENIQKEP